MLGGSAGLLTSPLQMKSVRNVSGALRAATALSFRPVVRKYNQICQQPPLRYSPTIGSLAKTSATLTLCPAANTARDLHTVYLARKTILTG